jgi:hypothetical protein
MAKDYWVVRVIKSFESSSGVTYTKGEVIGVRGEENKQRIKQGFLEEIDFDALEDEEENNAKEQVLTGPAWTDEEVGTFHFEDSGWMIRLELPAFDAFNPRLKRKRKINRYEISIINESPDEKPTPPPIAVTRKLISNQKSLAKKVAEALWADFNGKGPDSGMYWHGDLEQVAQGIESGEPPRSAKDLYKLMQLHTIHVQRTSGKSKRWLAEMNFHADFEEEHGVGILTDGTDIVGIGYSFDSQPFSSR